MELLSSIHTMSIAELRKVLQDNNIIESASSKEELQQQERKDKEKEELQQEERKDNEKEELQQRKRQERVQKEKENRREKKDKCQEQVVEEKF